MLELLEPLRAPLQIIDAVAELLEGRERLVGAGRLGELLDRFLAQVGQTAHQILLALCHRSSSWNLSTITRYWRSWTASRSLLPCAFALRTRTRRESRTTLRTSCGSRWGVSSTSARSPAATRPS